MMFDFAPDWIIRCPKCGKQKPLGETGAVRIGAASVGKRTLAWYKTCRWFRWAIIEREDSSESAKPSHSTTLQK